MSSFSDWCEQGEPQLRRTQQDAGPRPVYPRLANCEEASPIEPGPEPGSVAEQPAPAATGLLRIDDDSSIEAPERWDSLW